MIYNELSKFLRKLRVDKSLTQKDVADYLKVSPAFYPPRRKTPHFSTGIQGGSAIAD